MNGMILNDKTQEYIQKLQEILNEMKKDLPDVDYPRAQRPIIRQAMSYIGAIIYGLKLSENKK